LRGGADRGVSFCQQLNEASVLEQEVAAGCNKATEEDEPPLNEDSKAANDEGGANLVA